MKATIDLQVLDIFAGGATDIGTVRELNEDTIVAAHPVYVVADGMGGHAAGDIASELTAAVFETLSGNQSVNADDITRTVQAAQKAVSDLKMDAGSTVTGVIAGHTAQYGPSWFVINVGDSRTYRVIGQQIAPLTRDHSEVGQLLRAGVISPAEAKTHPRRNIITRAVGDGDSSGDLSVTPIVPGERLIICSDGLTGVITDEEIRRLATSPGEPTQIASQLVDAAIAAGTRDNTTVLVVQVGEYQPDLAADIPITILQVEADDA